MTEKYQVIVNGRVEMEGSSEDAREYAMWRRTPKADHEPAPRVRIVDTRNPDRVIC